MPQVRKEQLNTSGGNNGDTIEISTGTFIFSPNDSGTGGSESLSQTLDIGNTTDGYDIIISSNDVINFINDINIQKDGYTLFGTESGDVFIKPINNSGIVGLRNSDDEFRIYINSSGTWINDILYPELDGTNGQVLTTNGLGTLSFTTISTAVETLSETLNTGNTTDGYDIIISSNDVINFADEIGIQRDGYSFISTPNSGQIDFSVIHNNDVSLAAVILDLLGSGQPGLAFNSDFGTGTGVFAAITVTTPTTDRDGMDFLISGSNAGAGNNNGGNTVVKPGLGTGTGLDGYSALSDANSNFVVYVDPSSNVFLAPSGNTAVEVSDGFVDIFDNTIRTDNSTMIISASNAASDGTINVLATDINDDVLLGVGDDGYAVISTTTDNNVSLIAVPDDWANGLGVIFIGEGDVSPEGIPINGGFLYVENGELKYKGPSGTETALAPA